MSQPRDAARRVTGTGRPAPSRTSRTAGAGGSRKRRAPPRAAGSDDDDDTNKPLILDTTDDEDANNDPADIRDISPEDIPDLPAGSYRSSQDYADEVEHIEAPRRHLRKRAPVIALVSSDNETDEADAPARAGPGPGTLKAKERTGRRPMWTAHRNGAREADGDSSDSDYRDSEVDERPRAGPGPATRNARGAGRAARNTEPARSLADDLSDREVEYRPHARAGPATRISRAAGRAARDLVEAGLVMSSDGQEAADGALQAMRRAAARRVGDAEVVARLVNGKRARNLDHERPEEEDLEDVNPRQRQRPAQNDPVREAVAAMPPRRDAPPDPDDQAIPNPLPPVPFAPRVAGSQPANPPGAHPAPPQQVAASSTAKQAHDYVPSVLDILPDICPEWLLAQLKKVLDATPEAEPVQRVIQDALEGGYPKAEAKSKPSRSAAEPGAVEQFKSPVYRAEQRKGSAYVEAALQALDSHFALTPSNFIRSRFKEAHSQYVPAYFLLVGDRDAVIKQYVELKNPRARKMTKGKGRAVAFDLPDMPDDGAGSSSGAAEPRGVDMFQLEQAWLEEYLERQQRDKDEAEAKAAAHAQALADGGGIECGCCFTEEIWEELVQCPEGHLFCKDCVTQHAQMKLGEQTFKIPCMDQSGCQIPFPLSELRRILPEKSLELYHRLQQASELESAGIDGLETCPECSFAIVIDNPDEKLFNCLNPTCGKVSCRKCRKDEHLPKTCEENDKDRGLDKRHAIEDAMSAALIRQCPSEKCKKPFIKEDGCNKITCVKCGTMSCYICRNVIKNYEHFDQQPRDPNNPRPSTKCWLWDTADNNDHTLIAAARQAAEQDARAAAAAEGEQVAEEMLNVDMPAPPPNVQRLQQQAAAGMRRPPLAVANIRPDLAQRFAQQADALRAHIAAGRAHYRIGPDGVPRFEVQPIAPQHGGRDIAVPIPPRAVAPNGNAPGPARRRDLDAALMTEHLRVQDVIINRLARANEFPGLIRDARLLGETLRGLRPPDIGFSPVGQIVRDLLRANPFDAAPCRDLVAQLRRGLPGGGADPEPMPARDGLLVPYVERCMERVHQIFALEAALRDGPRNVELGAGGNGIGVGNAAAAAAAAGAARAAVAGVQAWAQAVRQVNH